MQVTTKTPSFDYLIISLQLILYVLLFYIVLILDTNLDVLYIETRIEFVILSLIVLFFVIKRSIVFAGIQLDLGDFFLVYLCIIFTVMDNSFYLLLDNFYFLFAILLLFDVYYLCSKFLSISYQLYIIQSSWKTIYASGDNVCTILQKGLIVKHVVGVIQLSLTTIPGGMVDELYQLLSTGHTRIIEDENGVLIQTQYHKRFILFNPTERMKWKTLKNSEKYFKNLLKYQRQS